MTNFVGAAWQVGGNVQQRKRAGWRSKGFSFTTCTIAFAILLMVPSVLTTTWLLKRQAAQKRAEIELAASATAHRIATEIDRIIVAKQTILITLATSPHLLDDNLAEFYQQSVELSRQLGMPFVLRAAHMSDIQLFNTAHPWGARLIGRRLMDQRHFREQLASGKPAVSNVSYALNRGDLITSIAVPLLRQGRLAYFLSSSMTADEFLPFLKGTALVPGQIATIVDREGTVVAHSLKQDVFAGEPIGQDWHSEHHTDVQGVVRGHDFNGELVQWAFHRSTATGWHVSIGTPVSTLEGPAGSELKVVGLIGALTFLLAIGGAYRFGGNMSRALATLKSAALSIGLEDQSRQELAPTATAVRETNELASALSAASAEVRQLDLQSRLALEAANLGMWNWDFATKAFSCSDRLQEIFGIPPNESTTHETILNLIHPADRVVIRQAMRARVSAGGDQFDSQYRICRGNDGELRWIHSKGKIDRNAAGRAVRIRGVVQDITEQKASERERDELRQRIMQIHEQERSRLARELHDQTGQILAAVMLELKGIETTTNPRGRTHLQNLRRELEQMSRSLHRMAYELRPASIADLGLVSALSEYIAEWSERHHIKADFHCRDSGFDPLPDEISTAIFRTIQEALTNIVKHAGATVVSVDLARTDFELRLTIEDNGRGFDSQIRKNTSLGLAGMRERLVLLKGELMIESTIGAGTALFARIPLEHERMPA